MSMCVHSSFKRMISPSNFATTIALLFFLARKDPGTACPFASFIDPFQTNIEALAQFAVSRELNSAVSLKSAPFRISALPLGINS